MKVRLTLFLFFGILYTNAIAQTTVWSEDFSNDENIGAIGSSDNPNTPTITSPGSGKWSVNVSNAELTQNTDWFKVTNGSFEARDIDGSKAIWISEVIDISAYASINISLNASETGDLETGDFINVSYIIDGGSQTLFAEASDDFTSVTLSSNTLEGSTLRIVIEVLNNAGTEYIRFDDIIVEGSNKIATPIFSLAEGTYHATQFTSISCPTEGASIYYTTDGSEPTTSSNLYSEPFEIYTSTTLKAIATKVDLDDSEVSSSVYTISINLLINEVDASGDNEFVELYDGGVGNTSLNGLVLVFYNGGDDEAYKDIDLDGFSTNDFGYFVVGASGGKFVDLINTTSIQDGADAVCLFVGDGADFTSTSTITTENLIDAIVYDNNDDDDSGLLPLLLSGENQINENGHSEPASRISIGRLSYNATDARKTSTYGHCYPTPGTENFSYDNAIFWNGSTTDISLASNWTGGLLPSPADDVVFETGASVSIATHFSCKSLIAESGTTINLNSGLLTINGGFSNNGSFSVKSSSPSQTGALIIEGSIAGEVTVERYIDNEDNPQDLWHAVSVPVSGQDIETFCEDANNGISAKDNNFAVTSYNTDDNTWKVEVDGSTYSYFFDGMTATNFELGKMYLMRKGVDGVLAFTGTPAIGDQSVSLSNSGDRWNGIANPYLTPVSGTLNGGGNCFLSDNSSNLDITSGIYIWDHKTGSYTTYNNTEDFNIPIGQGFIVKAASGASSVTFNTSCRNNNAATFKSASAPFEHFILEANGKNNSATTKLAFRNDMTLGLDAGYDASYLEGSSDLKMYTLTPNGENINLGIQALPSKFEGVIHVPVVLSSTIDQTVTLKPANTNGVSFCTTMLWDKNTSTQYPFNSTSDALTVQIGENEVNDSQFELILSNIVNSNESFHLDDENQIKVYYSDNQLHFKNTLNKEVQVRVYTISGRLCKSATLLGSNSINTNNLRPGSYLVQTITDKHVKSNKILLR